MAVGAADAVASALMLPATMSMREVQRSTLLTVMDILLFFCSAGFAARYWLETRARLLELKRMGVVDAQPLVCRCLLLQLLTLSNVLRAVGLVLDLQFHIMIYKGHKRHKRYPWHHWFDYSVSSLPTFTWISMLSVLLVFLIEIHQRSRLSWGSPWLRPFVLSLNIVWYSLYIIVAIATYQFRAYSAFRQITYCLLGIMRGLVSVSLLWHGHRLVSRLRTRRDLLLPQGGSGSSPQKPRAGILKVKALSIIIPVTELIRTYLDFSYVGAPTLNAGIPAVDFNKVFVLAAQKLVLEWIPSTVLLLAFRPHPIRQERFSTADAFDDCGTIAAGNLLGLDVAEDAGDSGVSPDMFVTPRSSGVGRR